MTDCQKELNETLPAAHGLHLRVPAGDIRIGVGEGDDGIRVHAVKHVRAVTEAEAQSFMEQMRIERRRDGDEWFVEATWPQPRPQGIRSASVSFEVRAPRGIAVEAGSGHGRIEATGTGEARLSTGSGDVSAAALTGTLSAHTGHGAIQCRECAGNVVAETGSGDIRISRAGQSVQARTGHGLVEVEACAGPVTIESGSGDVRVRDLAAALEARTGHGVIEVTRAAAARLQTSSGDLLARSIEGAVQARTGHGAIRIEECAGEVQAESSSGDIRIQRAPGRVSAQTGHGRIEASETGEAVLHTRSGDVQARGVSGSLEAETGHGVIVIEACAGPVRAESRSGDLRLRDASGPVHATTGHGSITAALRPSEEAVQVELAGNGEIELSLPATGSARIEADTGSGRVEMQPEVNAQLNPRRTHLEAVLADGRGSVRLRTGIGNIRIRLV